MSQAASVQTVEEVIRSRHAVRNFVKGFKIPQNELDEILELSSLAPSAWNLQHWKFLVIENEEFKQKLLPIAFGQQQIINSSVIVVILGDMEANKNVKAVYDPMVETGAIPSSVRDTLVEQVNGAYASIPQFGHDEALRNSSLAAMNLMQSAKAKGYDTSPMGGFDRTQFSKAFNVPERYIPSMLVAIGKAESPAHPTSRFALNELVIKETF